MVRRNSAPWTKALCALNVAIYYSVQCPALFSEETVVSPGWATALGQQLFGRWCPCVGPTPFYAMFALSGSALKTGHYWKLLTATFLHGSMSHVHGNMSALSNFGHTLEPSVGTARFLLIYACSGLVASMLSVHFLPLDKIGLGASGAVYHR